MFQFGKQELEISSTRKPGVKAFPAICSVYQLQQPLSCRRDGASGSSETVQQVILPAETS